MSLSAIPFRIGEDAIIVDVTDCLSKKLES
mgnify:CR=1 FL=1